MRACISGTGSYVPSRVMDNNEVCQQAPGTSDAWIQAHLGIVTRHIAADDENTSDLAAKAVKRALKAAHVPTDDVDGLICAVGTGDVLTPATASYVQKKVGLQNGGFAFDVKMACAGTVAAIYMARGLIESGLAKHVVVVGTAIMRRTTVDVTERTSAAIFGDGAGACVISATAGATGFMQSALHNDGRLTELVVQPMGGSRQPLSPEGLARGEQYLQMQGRAVWDCAMRVIPQVVHEVLDAEKMPTEKVDFLISHQANRNLVHAMMAKMEMPLHKTHTCMERLGNTVAASALIALDEAVRQNKIHDRDNVVLCAVGAGMGWGAHLMRWGSPT